MDRYEIYEIRREQLEAKKGRKKGHYIAANVEEFIRDKYFNEKWQPKKIYDEIQKKERIGNEAIQSNNNPYS